MNVVLFYNTFADSDCAYTYAGGYPGGGVVWKCKQIGTFIVHVFRTVYFKNKSGYDSSLSSKSSTVPILAPSIRFRQ